MPKDGGYALPSQFANFENKGISLRDLIAIAVLLKGGGVATIEDRAKVAYQIADAMITERDK